LLLTAYCLLLTAYCLLLTAYCLLLTEMIHPTAIIHPSARLGENVTIGAYAVIDGPAEIGDGCELRPHAIVTGRVAMGRENVVGSGTVLGGYPQDLSFKPEIASEVRIGDRNKFFEHCTVHRGAKDGTATTVGDDCFLMAGSHLGHNVTLGN